MTEKTVKTWEWMPRRAEAAIGLRLFALIVAGTFVPTVVNWLYLFVQITIDGTTKRTALMGVVDGIATAAWRMSKDNYLFRSGSVYVLCAVGIAAWCWFVVLSERGVPRWILRRCPRD